MMRWVALFSIFTLTLDSIALRLQYITRELWPLLASSSRTLALEPEVYGGSINLAWLCNYNYNTKTYVCVLDV